jgi:hypothetical protein
MNFIKTFHRKNSNKFSFDTYKLVRSLESNGFTRGQSVALMRTMNAFLVDTLLSTRSTLINSNSLENAIYIQKSQMQDIRNELTSTRQNDCSTLKRTIEEIIMELETLDSKYSDSIQRLKSDIQMDLNSHTNDHKEVVGNLNLRIQEANHKLVIKLADMKTMVESLKIELTTLIVWTVVGGSGILMGIDWVFDQLEQL